MSGEDSCATTGFLLMADPTPMDEFLHPLPEDGLEKAKAYAGMWKKLKQKYQTETSSCASK